MSGKDEDVFFLSNGHISPLWYATLARFGYFDVKELATFRRLNSRLQGHPTTHEGLPGVRIASGSLGQGLSVGCGVALGKKMSGDDKKVFVLTGDGELQEGQNWEAIMFAAHYRLDNMVAIVDWNGQQIDGSNDNVMSLGDLEAKWSAFGWETYRVEGNDMDKLTAGFEKALEHSGKQKPKVILLHTEMGYGVDFMMGSHKWHGSAPNDAQCEAALAQLEETLGDY